MAISAVLLDIDGTLVDSNDAHAGSWVDALAAHGHKVQFDRVRRLIGKGGDKLLPEVTGIDSESPEGKKISKTRKQIFKEQYLPKLKAFPKTRALIDRMRQDGLELVVATSAEKELADALLEVANVRDLIDEQTTSDDAERSKPDPDIVDAAVDQSDSGHRESMMIGDTPYDIEAAEKAGVRCIAFRCGGLWTDAELGGAIAIYDGPADLLAQYDRSPLGRRR